MSKYESIKGISLSLFSQQSFSNSLIKLKERHFCTSAKHNKPFACAQKNENLNLEPMNCCSILKDHN